jgi:hypothetical protein
MFQASDFRNLTMIAYFDGFVDTSFERITTIRLETIPPLISTTPYVVSWNHVYVSVPDTDISNEQILQVLNGAVVGLLTCDKRILLPESYDSYIYRLKDIPLLPCIGLGKMRSILGSEFELYVLLIWL